YCEEFRYRCDHPASCNIQVLMKRPKVIAAVCVAAVGLAMMLAGLIAHVCSCADANKTESQHPAMREGKSAAHAWLDIALEATAREHERNGPRPTVGSRMLAIIVTAIYDAWAAYDDTAIGTQLGGRLRRPRSERTDVNKEIAIAYASYRAMLN